MRIRTTFVGVDAHIDPHAARPILRYVAAKSVVPNGRTEASAPTGRCTFAPIVHPILRLRIAGSMWASTPTDIFRIRHPLYIFDGASRAGRACPAPTVRRKTSIIHDSSFIIHETQKRPPGWEGAFCTLYLIHRSPSDCSSASSTSRGTWLPGRAAPASRGRRAPYRTRRRPWRGRRHGAVR